MDAANETEMKIALLVLAAGGSRRMNAPKQLLKFEGRTLLRRGVETAIQTKYRPIIVVLGANFEKTRAEIEDLSVEITFNENWETGLSSSIKCGIAHLLKIAPGAEACLVTLADQPLIEAERLDLFAERFDPAIKSIVAARYRGITGVPALFARSHFDELRNLSGDRGAKAIFENYRERISTVELPEAAFDIDTPEDFERLKNRI